MSIEANIQELTAAVRELTQALTQRVAAPVAVPVTAAEVIAERDANNLTMADAKKAAQAKKAKTQEPAASAATTASVTEGATAEELGRPLTAAEAPAATFNAAAKDEKPVAAVAEPVAAVAEPVAANDATYEDVRSAFMALNTAKGREATVAVLAELGAGRVPDIKPEQFGKAVQLAKAAM